MAYFDANVFVGRWPLEKLAYNNVDGLHANMCRLGIDRALVAHTIAWQNSPALGNRMLMEAINIYSDLEPCWVITPGLQVEERGGLKALFEEMAHYDVRAVRLFPRDHVFSLTEKMSVELLNVLNRHHYLVIIDLDQIFTQSGLYDYSAGSLEVLNELCSHYPDVSFLLTKVGYRAFQILFPLIQTHSNLYLDLSFFATHQGVEVVVESLGAERLLFGTGQPLIDPGGALLRLTSASISEADIQKIAGRNLEQLLGRAQFDSLPKSRTITTTKIKNNSVAKRWSEIPLDIEIVDAHVHMGPYHKFYIPQNSPEDMLHVMDHLHIAQSCVSSHLAISGDWYTGNRLTAQAVTAHPDRFIGYVVVSPNEPDLIEPELKQAFDEWGFKGIKLVPDTHLQPIGSDGYQPVFKFASHRQCLVLVHTYHGSRFDDPQLFGSVAKQYPEVPILMVHSGALTTAFEGAITLAKDNKNLYLDISGSFITADWIERMVLEIGADRVLFSSDQPFIDPRYSLGRLLNANLSMDALAQVIGGNIKRLLYTHTHNHRFKHSEILSN